MTNQNPFIWHELVTPDQKKSGAFFSQLFGWTRKETDAGQYGIYTLFQKDGRDVAGVMNPTLIRLPPILQSKGRSGTRISR